MFNTFSRSLGFGRRPWQPTSFPDMTIWYNADYSGNNFNQKLNSGDTFTQWSDKSGNSHNANQSGNTSFRPQWISPVQNNQGVVRLDGVAKFMSINPVAYLQSLPAFTMFIVAKPSVLTGTRYLIGSDTNDLTIYFNGTNWAVENAGGIGTSTITADTSAFRIFTLIYDGTQTGNANRLKFRYNKSQRTLNFGATTVGTTVSSGIKNVYLGTNDNKAVTGYFGGDCAEIMLYLRALSSTEITTAEKYFSDHWAI